MALRSFWKCVSAALAAVALAAQTGGVVSIGAIGKLVGKRNEVAEARIPVVLQPGYHVNSNTPAEAYLIPLRLTWEKGLLETIETVFPKPKLEKYEFSTKPVSVFTGNFDVVTKFRITPDAASGPGIVLGKLRYQACSTSACLPPKTAEVRLPIQVR
jgi:hypothetical protein